MATTKKLYENDSYLMDFEATVTGCIVKNGNFLVELDKTAFFPTQGGQTCDRGTLGGCNVKDVFIEHDTVYHVTDKNFDIGERVKGCVDYDYRFRNMQMHSGEHIFSGTVNRLFGYDNVGFHLSDNSATMDFNGKLTDEEVRLVENRVNEIIVSNKRITVSYPTSEKMEQICYRSKKEIEGSLRLVSIQDVDICACCAPHVKLTGEIGLFKVIATENYKEGIRVHFLAGFRAIDYFSEAINSLKGISSLLSAKRGQELEAVGKLSEENRNNKYAMTGLKYDVIREKVAKMPDNAGILFLPENFSDCLRFAVDSIKEKCKGTAGAFAGSEEQGFKFLIDSDCIDFTMVAKRFREAYGAKCGGRADSIQGSICASKNDISETICQ